jgi:hypothetical protein
MIAIYMNREDLEKLSPEVLSQLTGIELLSDKEDSLIP